MIMNEIKIFIFSILPSIHNLSDVIYIRWMNRDWYIEKK